MGQKPTYVLRQIAPIDQPVDADEHGSFGQSRFPKTLNH